MKRYSILFFCFLAFAAQAQQTDQQYLLKYKEAVQEYANHNFNDAIIQLAPLTREEHTNAVVPYAMYYYSLSAFESKKYFQAREMLRKLFERYPDWEKIEEAYYLYADANFSENYIEEALTYTDRIRDEEILESVEELVNHHIPTLMNVNQLKELNKNFPNQKVVAKTLVKRIQDRPYNSREDLELSDLLTNRFKLKDEVSKPTSEKAYTNYARAFDDSTMDFGILLPFEIKAASNGVQNIKNQYVYDMFAGMQIAEQMLQNSGVPIRIFGIDVGSDPVTIKEHLEDKKFVKMDLIFGPLYPQPNRVASTYAKKHKIIQVHPLSNNENLIANQPTVFLLQPSYTTQSQKSLDFADKMNWAKTCVIYFDEGRKDSVFAYTYKQEAEKRGYKVLDIRSVRESSRLKPDLKPGHVFITGDDTFGSKITRTMGRDKVSGPVMSTASSFNFQKVSRASLRDNLYFIYPEFVDLRKSEVESFKDQYISKMNTIPSYFSYLGYDMVKFYSMMLKDGKEIFRLNLDDSRNITDFTLSGFDYSGGRNENQEVPIVKWDNGIFETVN